MRTGLDRAGDWHPGPSVSSFAVALAFEFALAQTAAGGEPAASEFEVEFAGRGVQLSGTIRLPADRSGPAPAVVFVHGSGPSRRSNFAEMADLFASAGIASLRYDKRGVGASTGDWHAGFDDLAADAAAGLATLRTRPEVDPDRVGFWSISQGGWIAPLAATRTEHAGFLVLVSAPAVTPLEQQLTTIRNEYRINGFPDDLRTFHVELVTDYVANPNPDAATRAAFADRYRTLQQDLGATLERDRGAEHAARITAILLPLTPQQFADGFANQIDWHYDPIPVLERVRCPVLAIWGALDALVPPDQNRPVMEAALARGANPQARFLVFPDADHLLQISKTGSVVETLAATDPRPAPGYLDAMTGWIRGR